MSESYHTTDEWDVRLLQSHEFRGYIAALPAAFDQPSVNVKLSGNLKLIIWSFSGADTTNLHASRERNRYLSHHYNYRKFYRTCIWHTIFLAAAPHSNGRHACFIMHSLHNSICICWSVPCKYLVEAGRFELPSDAGQSWRHYRLILWLLSFTAGQRHPISVPRVLRVYHHTGLSIWWGAEFHDTFGEPSALSVRRRSWQLGR